MTLRILYTLLMIHLLPFFVLRLYWRSLKVPAYRQRIRERFAWINKRSSKKPLIWVHAVSVGEVMAATPMIRQMMLQYPGHEFCVTTTTPTGSERVLAAFTDDVHHYYLPYDIPVLMALFIRSLKPQILLVMETELWPNLIASCHSLGVPSILLNGRMSARSAAGYKRFSSVTKPMLNKLDLIAVQSDFDAKRFIELGALEEKINIMGSVKFDVAIDQRVNEKVLRLQSQLNPVARRVAIFASTHIGEDELILPMVKRLVQLNPDFLAIIVPRHPERFDVVASLAEKLKMNMQRLSERQATDTSTHIVVADTMGDMLALYGLADIAFVGGSLVAHGGHNFLEAAAWGLPIISGQSVFNFYGVAKSLEKEGGLRIVQDHFTLERTFEAWMKNPAEFAALGVAAKQVLLNNQGALGRAIDCIDPFIEEVNVS